MLDKLYVKRNSRTDVFTDEYLPDQVITGRKLINPGAERLAVLFPPWHGGGKPYETLAKRLARQGHAVLAYYFHNEILKPDVEQVAASYTYIRDVASRELRDLKAARDYRHTTLIAMSLGNPALSIVTSKFNDFDSAVMVVPASSLARSMWYGTRTQHVRTGIERQGYVLDDVETAWADLAPINHLDVLRDKSVNLVLSLTDDVIPTKYQVEFLEGAKAFGVNPNIQKTRLGHYASIGRFCLVGNIGIHTS